MSPGARPHVEQPRRSDPYSPSCLPNEDTSRRVPVRPRKSGLAIRKDLAAPRSSSTARAGRPEGASRPDRGNLRRSVPPIASTSPFVTRAPSPAPDVPVTRAPRAIEQEQPSEVIDAIRSPGAVHARTHHCRSRCPVPGALPVHGGPNPLAVVLHRVRTFRLSRTWRSRALSANTSSSGGRACARDRECPARPPFFARARRPLGRPRLGSGKRREVEPPRFGSCDFTPCRPHSSRGRPRVRM